jgi:serine/threonine protein kinase
MSAPQLHTEHSSGTLLGPYRLTGVLGQGGMGIVYRGRHVETGDEVAVKTLDAVSPAAAQAIVREIRALTVLRHSGIARIREGGVTDGRPWYAMDLIAGVRLRDRLSAALPSRAGSLSATTQREDSERDTEGASLPPPTTVPESPPIALATTQLLPILIQVCDALSYLHEAGFVHRDLKPENIVVREDGSAVLIDLGICARFAGAEAHEAFELPDSNFASPRYAAPEQRQGALVDARADLYALGCMLYECLTGGLPRFPMVSDVAAIRQAPFAPSQLYPGIPATLDALVLGLLAAEPDQRIGYADDVGRELRAYLHADGPRAPAPLRPTNYLYRPHFVGREHPLRLLREATRKLVVHGQGGTTWLQGAAGIGKTRLALEVVQRARTLGAQVILCRASRIAAVDDSAAGAVPLETMAPVLGAIADACHVGGERVTRELLGEHSRLLAAYEPRLRAAPGFDQLGTSLPSIAAEARRRSLLQISSALLAMAQARPLFIAIDDLQWADDTSLDLLGALLQATSPQTPLVLFGTCRAGAVSEKLRALLAFRPTLSVEPLEAGDVGQLVRGMLAIGHVPEALSTDLHAISGGNPVAIVEFLRAAIETGQLARTRGGWEFAPTLVRASALNAAGESSGGLRTLVNARLDRLPSATAHVLGVAAVLGRSFDDQALRLCTELPDEQVAHAVGELERQMMLAQGERGGLEFIHELVREVAYERLPPERRRPLHGRVAEYLAEAARRDGARAHAAAWHFAQAGEALHAAEFALQAGLHARQTFSIDDAIARYREAEHQLTAIPAAERGTVWRERWVACLEALADALTSLAQREEARAALGRLLSDESAQAVPRARWQRKQGKTLELDRRYNLAAAAYAEATATLTQASSDGSEWWAGWIDLEIDRLWLLYWTADLASLETLLPEALAHALQHGSAAQRAQVRQTETLLRVRRERYRLSDATVAGAEAALRDALEAQDFQQIPLARFGLAFALLLSGRLETAKDAMTTAGVEAERSGDRALFARVSTYQLMLRRREGLVADTRSLAVQAETDARRANMKDYIGAAVANLGWADWKRGQCAEARARLEEAIAQWRVPPAVFPFEWMALFPLLGLELEAKAYERCHDIAGALLRESQERFPDDLDEALAAVIAGGDTSIAGRLATVLSRAAKYGYV